MNNIEKDIPLLYALTKHHEKKAMSFHVPGHKNGAVFPHSLTPFYKSILNIDVTELDGLDDLHAPTGVILEAKKRLSTYYQTKESYFLVNGSTSGNLAMVLATCKEGDLVFVQRNSHKSIFHALQLARVNPVFINPDLDAYSQLPVSVALETIKQAYKQYPNVKAVILTHPNYYGMSKDITPIVDYLHDRGVTVLVDEAHGAHFKASTLFPKSAIDAGADLVVQSAHKTLPAMTMGAYLHVNHTYHSLDRLRYYLQVVQSSSPSYPIMASLDIARYYLEQLSEADIQEIVDEMNHFKASLRQIPQIEIYDSKDGLSFDPLKIIVRSRCTRTGFDIQQLLNEKGIYTELADVNHVLFVWPLQKIEQADKIALKIQSALQNELVTDTVSSIPSVLSDGAHTLALTYKEMEQKSVKEISARDCVGEIAAESIIPYPPGVPLVIKGERITQTHLECARQLKQAGAIFQGNDLQAMMKVYV